MTNKPDRLPLPCVSVVIVNWNTRDLLLQTIESLHEQTREVTFETIVVDNGSHDGSADAVTQAWPEVAIVRLPDNRGFAAANNVGFERSHGRYVLLLNSDTIVLPTTLSGLVDVLDNDPGVGAVGARHLNGDGSLQRSMDEPPSLAADFRFFFLNDVLNALGLSERRSVRRWLESRSLWWGPHDELVRAGWVNGACIMVRRTVIDEVGGLDEEFFIYGEEVDWCHRIRVASHAVVFTPAAEVIHLGGQAMNSASDDRVHLKYLGMLTYYRKNVPRQLPAFIGMVRMIALARVCALAVIAACEKFGVHVDDRTWRLVAQEVVRTSPTTLMRAWWRIARLSRSSTFAEHLRHENSTSIRSAGQSITT